MHSAPSVTYPVGRSRSAAGLLLLLWLAGAGAIAAWFIQAPDSVVRESAAVAALGASAVGAAWQWWRAPCGHLAWNGEGWTWESDGEPEAGEPDVSLDLQRWLLLHWRGAGATRWLWLERSRRAPAWNDLRRAVYSRARLQALPGAQQPAAKT